MAEESDVTDSRQTSDGALLDVPFCAYEEKKVPCVMPAHQGPHGEHSPSFFEMIGFRDSTREIPGHHALVGDVFTFLSRVKDVEVCRTGA
jgi:hypothetical protein